MILKTVTDFLEYIVKHSSFTMLITEYANFRSNIMQIMELTFSVCRLMLNKVSLLSVRFIND